jgi:hypothetical protein
VTKRVVEVSLVRFGAPLHLIMIAKNELYSSIVIERAILKDLTSFFCL